MHSRFCTNCLKIKKRVICGSVSDQWFCKFMDNSVLLIRNSWFPRFLQILEGALLHFPVVV